MEKTFLCLIALMLFTTTRANAYGVEDDFSNYTQVEWIESVYPAYTVIDDWQPWSHSCGYDFDGIIYNDAPLMKSTDNVVFGFYEGDAAKDNFCFNLVANFPGKGRGTHAVGWNVKNSKIGDQVALGVRSQVSVRNNGDYDASTGKSTITWTTPLGGTYNEDVTLNKTHDIAKICIFGIIRGKNNDPNIEEFSHSRIYSLKFYEYDNVVRDFVPVVRKSDGEPGLYEKKMGKFYSNQGAGSFVVGEAVDLAYGENLVTNGENPALEGWKQKNGVVDGVSYTKMVADALMKGYSTSYEGDHTTDFNNQRVVFHGASNSHGYIYQDIRLDNFVPQTGNLNVDVYGTLSYYKTQGDYAGIEFGFYDENGILIGSKVHYTNKDHEWPNTTDYVIHDKTSSVVVPANTDFVRVSCYSVIKGTGDDNDGCILQVGLKAASNVITINYITNGSTVAPTSANYGEVAVSSVVPVKPGAIFLGWSMTEGGNVDYASGELFVHKNGVSYNQGATTLYAVWEEELSYTRPTTAGRYGTICLPKGAEAINISGATFYSIAGKRVDSEGLPTSIVLEEVQNIEAGKPYVFLASGTELKVVYSGESVAEASSENGLVGSFTGQDVAEGMYLLSNNQIIKCGTGCSIGTNRAFINMTVVPEYVDGSVSPSKIAIIGLEGTTAINSITIEGDAIRYNLSGIRIPAGTKGITIINGKKVVNK